MKILKTSFTIIGAIIGAGFASGNEIFEYFAKYGKYSFFCIIPLFLLMFIVLKTYMQFGNKIKVFNLKVENTKLCKNFNIFNKEINYMNIFMFFTFLILCSAMFGGLVALFKTYISNIPSLFLYIFIIILSLIMSKISFKCFEFLSFLAVPLIILCIILMYANSFTGFNFNTTFENANYLFLVPLNISYVFQNIFLSCFTIINCSTSLTNKQQTKCCLLVSGIICLLIVIGIVCLLNNPSFATTQMPFASIFLSFSTFGGAVYGIIILLSILTTYSTTLSSLKEFFTGNKKYNKPIIMIALIALISLLDFGTIIEYLYPIIGMFGFVYFIKIASKIYSYKNLDAINKK